MFPSYECTEVISVKKKFRNEKNVANRCNNCNLDHDGICKICYKHEFNKQFPISINEWNYPTSTRRIATVTVIWDSMVLTCRKGVDDHNYGKLFSQGGKVEIDESFEEGCIREAYEEAGIKIDIRDLKVLSYGNSKNYDSFYMNFYIIYNTLPLVEGPPINHIWELKDENYILGFNTIKNSQGENTRLAWVPIEIALSCGEYSMFIKNLTEIHKIMNESNNYLSHRLINADMVKPLRNTDMSFVGYEQMRKLMLNQVAKFNSWNENRKRENFHNSHYDWWTFPINNPSSYGLMYTVYADDIKELKDFIYTPNLIRCATLVCNSWGWDLELGEEISKRDFSQQWRGWSIRLYKMTLSLLCFGLNKQSESCIKLGRLLISRGDSMIYNGRDLKHLYI